jgi:hypothetical protein
MKIFFSFKGNLKSLAIVGILLAAAVLPLAAQDVFTISEINDSYVLVTLGVRAGEKASVDAASGFRPFEIFDVYASGDLESGFGDFVDSLYFMSVSNAGIVMGYVWKGEKKFIQRSYFVIRTGRTYSLARDGASAAEAIPGAAPRTAAAAATPPKQTYPGSFGVSGLEVTFDAGLGPTIGIYDETMSGMGGASLVASAAAKARLGVFGLSLRANIPFMDVIPDTVSLSSYVSACLDLYWDVLPFMGIYGSIGGSVAFGTPSTSVFGIAAGFGVYLYLPIFGEISSFMPYIEVFQFSPSIGQGLAFDCTVLLAGVRF